MNILVLKLLLTPTLVGAASLAGRRWGPAVSGWIVALPLTSAPITFFLAITQGEAFAAATALGILTGGVSLAIFSASYAWLARRRRWPLALLVSSVLFLAATAGLQFVLIPLFPLFFTIILALLLALRLMPPPDRDLTAASALPRWDLPFRMIVATFFVVLLTGMAPVLGARLTGLLSTFPVFAATLTAFAHHQQGPDSAARVLRGLLMGLFSFAGFYLVLSTLLEPAGIGPAFGAAILTTLILQAISLWMIRRSKHI
jgi:hypothetical protein